VKETPVVSYSVELKVCISKLKPAVSKRFAILLRLSSVIAGSNCNTTGTARRIRRSKHGVLVPDVP
jgi:hypothetical protein